MKTDMTPKDILIRKYENRRLYDATNSQYVNLDEVAKMLQNGDHVRVVDAATGEDITRLILTQIIVEDAKAPDSNFPLDVLRQMVIASGKVSQEGALKYMKTMLDMYQSTYRAIAPPLNPFEFIQRADATSGGVSDPRPVAPDTEGTPRPAKNAEAKKVDELNQRVAELETLVSTLAKKKAPQKKKALPIKTTQRKK